MKNDGTYMYLLHFFKPNVVRVGLTKQPLAALIDQLGGKGLIDAGRSAIATAPGKSELLALKQQLISDYAHCLVRPGTLYSECLPDILQDIAYKVNKFPHKGLKLVQGIANLIPSTVHRETIKSEEAEFSPWSDDIVITLNDKVPILEFEAAQEGRAKSKPEQLGIQSKRYLLPGCGFIVVTARALSRTPLGIKLLARILRYFGATGRWDRRTLTFTYEAVAIELGLEKTDLMLATLHETIRSYRHIGATIEGVGSWCSFKLLETLKCPRPTGWADSFAIGLPRDFYTTFDAWFQLSGFDCRALQWDELVGGEDISKCFGLVRYDEGDGAGCDRKAGQKRRGDAAESAGQEAYGG